MSKVALTEWCVLLGGWQASNMDQRYGTPAGLLPGKKKELEEQKRGKSSDCRWYKNVTDPARQNGIDTNAAT